MKRLSPVLCVVVLCFQEQEDEIINGRRSSDEKLNVPILVIVAVVGIVTTRCLDLLLLFNMYGIKGTVDFVHRSAQTWTQTLIFFASLVMLFVELRCAIAIFWGRNWGRWLFLLTQMISVACLWLVSLGWEESALFSIHKVSGREVLHSLLTQKLPDALVLLLLFVPARSRLFFRRQ